MNRTLIILSVFLALSVGGCSDGGDSIDKAQSGQQHAVERAAEVRACEQAHGLSKASDAKWRTSPKEIGEVSNRTRVFQFCDWPPSPGADPDGYSEISVRFAEGPDTSSESSWPAAYRITSHNCQTFAVVVAQYDNTTGHVQRLPAMLIGADEVKTVEDEAWQDDAESPPLPFLRRSDEAIILSNGHYGLDGITCQEHSSLDAQSSDAASGSEASSTATVEDAAPPPTGGYTVNECGNRPAGGSWTYRSFVGAGQSNLTTRNVACRLARSLVDRVRFGNTPPYQPYLPGWSCVYVSQAEEDVDIRCTSGTRVLRWQAGS